MKKITRKELINMYLKFFEEKGHSIIGSASVIPENDASVLFTTAGMHPLVPYLLGNVHPEGKRLTDVQKCIRTGDIEEVGDATHLTFFEMLGNWSLGDYFKKEMIPWSYEFLTSEKYLGINPSQLAFSVFEGNEEISKDVESALCWEKCGVPKENIYYLGKKHNFWELGTGSGPCGPDTEMFVKRECKKNDKSCNPGVNCGCFVEIWNDVFMECLAKDGKYLSLENKNVDTGMGLERTLMIFNDLSSVYDTEMFINARDTLEKVTNTKYEDHIKNYRIILDHIRTSVFILGDDTHLTPSNTGRGYVLRRLIRRAIRYMKALSTDIHLLENVCTEYIDYFSDFYPELRRNKDFILSELSREIDRFSKTINSGMKEFNKTISNLKTNEVDGINAFKLFDTYGFPLEFTIELANEKGLSVDVEGFKNKMKEHQDLSRTASQGEFKGGLADTSYESTKYHTLAHIMLACLKEMYGDTVIQKGSNITPERLRYDFPLEHKMEEKEKERLTKLVNEVIKKGLPVIREEMTYDEAIKSGASGIFTDKYGSKVSVYTIPNVSKEICGGPHVNNTSELGTFKIIKEESSSSGVRRIKAVLTNE